MWISDSKRVVLAMAVLLGVSQLVRASDEVEVRSTVQRTFEQLKSRDYGTLYDSLPASSRTRMSRERFSNALKRANDLYVLDRIAIGPVSLSANLAVVDTVLYGRVLVPFEAEGKIVVQQYLVRENGQWRIATGDRETINRFLASNPGFARRFTVRRPKLYVRQGGNWIEFSLPRRSAP